MYVLTDVTRVRVCVCGSLPLVWHSQPTAAPTRLFWPSSDAQASGAAEHERERHQPARAAARIDNVRSAPAGYHIRAGRKTGLVGGTYRLRVRSSHGGYIVPLVVLVFPTAD
jgi:hypothetical protein